MKIGFSHEKTDGGGTPHSYHVPIMGKQEVECLKEKKFQMAPQTNISKEYGPGLCLSTENTTKQAKLARYRHSLSLRS